MRGCKQVRNRLTEADSRAEVAGEDGQDDLLAPNPNHVNWGNKAALSDESSEEEDSEQR